MHVACVYFCVHMKRTGMHFMHTEVQLQMHSHTRAQAYD